MEEVSKKKRKTLLLVLAASVMLIAVAIAVITASIKLRYDRMDKEAAAADPEVIEEYYYYNQLTYKEQILFKALKTAADVYESKSEIIPYRYTEEEFNRAATALSFDCPSLFYLDLNSLRLYCDGYKTYVKIGYFDTPTSIKHMKMEVEAVSAAAMAFTSNAENDFEKAVILHDFLTRICVYAGKQSADTEIKSTSHTAYGALIDNLAYCDGYAMAYKLLLNRCGIEAIIAEGATDVRPHLWNTVNIDGKYYHIDSTWNDADVDYLSEVSFHGYFCLSDEKITVTHEIFDTFEMPECTDGDDYYVKSDVVVSSPEDFEEAAFVQLKAAAEKKKSYIELNPLYTENEKDYEESMLRAIDRVNALYEKSVYSRSFRAFKASDASNGVTVLLYLINQ